MHQPAQAAPSWPPPSHCREGGAGQPNMRWGASELEVLVVDGRELQVRAGRGQRKGVVSGERQAPRLGYWQGASKHTSAAGQAAPGTGQPPHLEVCHNLPLRKPAAVECALRVGGRRHRPKLLHGSRGIRRRSARAAVRQRAGRWEAAGMSACSRSSPWLLGAKHLTQLSPAQILPSCTRNIPL